jgi:PAS domain S-box-containing protein
LLNSHDVFLVFEVQLASEKYRSLIRLNPTSTTVLRLFASFLLNLAQDTPQGLQILSKADELEEHNQRTKTDGRQDALFNDRNAVVIASGDRFSLGEIVNVNVGATRLFGYSQSEIVGMNLNSLMPMPFSSYHNSWMSSYNETGKSKIVNAPGRNVFALHRSGYIFRAELNVREFSSSCAQMLASSGAEISAEGEDELNFSPETLIGSNAEHTDTSFIGVLKPLDNQVCMLSME